MLHRQPDADLKSATGNEARPLILFVILCCALPGCALANGGAPALILLWPPLILLMLPAVYLEARFAESILGLPRQEAHRLALRANVISTLFGVPLTGVLLAVGSFLIPGMLDGIAGSGRQSLLDTLSSILFFSGFIAEMRGAPAWAFGAGMSLAVLVYLLASILIEYHVALRMHRTIPFGQLRRWAWIANVSSYSAIVLLTLATLMVWTAR